MSYRYSKETKLSHNEQLEEMAYLLSVSRKGTQKRLMRDELLRYKRKNFIDDIPGAYIEQRKRDLSITNDFRDILSVIRHFDKDRGRQIELCAMIIGYITVEIANASAAMLDDEDLEEQSGFLFRNDWFPFISYLREHDKDAVSKMFDKSKQKNLFQLSIDSLYAENGRWNIEYENVESDKTLLAKYDNDSEFYKYAKKNLERLLGEAISLTFVTCAPINFRDNMFAGAKEDWDDLNDVKERMEARTRNSSPLSSDYNEDIVPPTEEEWLKCHILCGLQKVVDEFALSGIDLPSFFISTNVSSKNTMTAIKQGFALYETKNGKCAFKLRKEQRAVVEMIVRIWVISAVGRRFAEAIKGNLKTKGEAKSEAKKLIERLKEDNEKLKKRLDESSAKEEKNLKAKDQNIKALQLELASLRAELKEKDEKISDLNDEIEDIKSICEDMTAEEPEEEEVSGAVHDEFFRSYIQEHKVIVWGLRDEIRARFEKMYPELTYIDSDRTLTRQQLDKCDVFILNTSYTNHSKYWAARDMVKNADIPLVQLRKTACNPSKLVEALDIALGRNN